MGQRERASDDAGVRGMPFVSPGSGLWQRVLAKAKTVDRGTYEVNSTAKGPLGLKRQKPLSDILTAE